MKLISGISLHPVYSFWPSFHFSKKSVRRILTMRTYPRHMGLLCSPNSVRGIHLPTSCRLKVINSQGCTAASPLNVFSCFHNNQMLFSSTLNLISHFTPIPLSCNRDHLWLHMTPQARRGWVWRQEPYSLLCSSENTLKYTHTNTRETMCQPN